MTGHPCGALVVTGGLLLAACGGAETDTNAQATVPPAESATTTVAPPDALPLIEDATTTTEAPLAPTPTTTTEGRDRGSLPEGPLCDWLFEAEFSNDAASVHFFRGGAVEIIFEDTVDTQGVDCIDDQLLLLERPNVVLTLDSSDGLRIVDQRMGDLIAEEWVSWDEILEVNVPDDPADARAYEAGLSFVEFPTNRDPALYAETWIDLEGISRDVEDLWSLDRTELLALIQEELLGFEEGKTIRDYHAAYEPELSRLEDWFTDPQIERVAQIFGTTDLRIFTIGVPQDGGARGFSLNLPYQILLISHDGGETWLAAGAGG